MTMSDHQFVGDESPRAQPLGERGNAENSLVVKHVYSATMGMSDDFDDPSYVLPDDGDSDSEGATGRGGGGDVGDGGGDVEREGAAGEAVAGGGVGDTTAAGQHVPS